MKARAMKEAWRRVLVLLALIFATGMAAAAPQAPGTASFERRAMIAEATSSTLFDLQNSVSIRGTVRAFDLSKAYSQLWLTVPDSAGNSTVWNFQAASSLELPRLDRWTDQSLNPGDEVTAEYFPFSDARRPGGILIAVTTADGRTLSGGTPADFARMQLNMPRLPQRTSRRALMQRRLGKPSSSHRLRLRSGRTSTVPQANRRSASSIAPKAGMIARISGIYLSRILALRQSRICPWFR